MLDFKGKHCAELLQKLAEAGLNTNPNLDVEFIYDEVAAQVIIDAFVPTPPNLLPVQFFYLLAKYKLDDAIDTLLVTLKTADINQYAVYKAFLSGSRFYEFGQTMQMFKQVRSYLVAINPILDFTDEQLQEMWLEASLI